MQTRQTSYRFLSMCLRSNQVHGDGHPLTLLIEYCEKGFKRYAGVRYSIESLLDLQVVGVNE